MGAETSDCLGISLEVKWRRGGEEKIYDISSLVFLGNVKDDGVRQVAFARGPRQELSELFAWGAHSWPMRPFDIDTKLEIERILLEAARDAWNLIDPRSMVTCLYSEVPGKQKLGNPSKLSRFELCFLRDKITVGGVEDCLIFLKVQGEKKLAADGWGSEKKSLIFYGAEKFFGPEVSGRLRLAIFGPLADMMGKMLQSFRAQGRVEGGLTLTPEAWEQHAKEKWKKSGR